MSWAIYLVLFAFALYLCYNFLVLSLFGVPHSLSETYYLFQKRSYWQRTFFPIMMIGIGIFLLPAWLEISALSPFMFTAFLASGGIIFTGMVPAFNNSKMEDRVHTISAFLGAIFALIWVVLVAKLWWFIFVWAIFIVLLAILTNTWKSSYTYWIETIAILSTFTAIISFFII